MYCAEAEALIRRVHSVRQMFVSKSYGDQMKEDVSGGVSSLLPGTYSETTQGQESKTPDESDDRKSLADPWLEKIADAATRDRGKSQVTDASARRRLWNNMANIPETMLDSSINFQTGCKTIYEETSDKRHHWTRESTSIDEGDEYRSLHEKIASGEDSLSSSLPQ